MHYNGAERGWQRLVAARKAIDLTQETADETAEGDAQVTVFPVRTEITRLLTNQFGFDDSSADCEVYVFKPLDGDDDPLMDTELCQHIDDTVSKLELANKNRIDFHFILAEKGRESWQRNREAFSNKMVGDAGEAQRLAKSLGFKTSTVTF